MSTAFSTTSYFWEAYIGKARTGGQNANSFWMVIFIVIPESIVKRLCQSYEWCFLVAVLKHTCVVPSHYQLCDLHLYHVCLIFMEWTIPPKWIFLINKMHYLFNSILEIIKTTTFWFSAFVNWVRWACHCLKFNQSVSCWATVVLG